MPAEVTAEGVCKSFGRVRALDAVSLSVAAGEAVALVGESGAGKTTLLQCFNRLVEPDSGRVTFHGEDVRSFDPVHLRRTIGYVPQEGGLLPHWTVLRNVGLVPFLRGEPEMKERAAEALNQVGLDPAEYGGRWPRELSGGQRQRVALARALAGRPKLLLLDEPFGALDALTRAELQRAFAALRSRLGLTAVLVTHDLREAAHLCDRIAVFVRGRLEQVDTPGRIRSAPATEYVRGLFERAGAR